jgi:hypothetical protein
MVQTSRFGLAKHRIHDLYRLMGLKSKNTNVWDMSVWIIPRLGRLTHAWNQAEIVFLRGFMFVVLEVCLEVCHQIIVTLRALLWILFVKSKGDFLGSLPVQT